MVNTIHPAQCRHGFTYLFLVIMILSHIYPIFVVAIPVAVIPFIGMTWIHFLKHLVALLVVDIPHDIRMSAFCQIGWHCHK